MLIQLDQAPSLVTQFVADLRNVNVQKDRLRFRRNLERIAEVAALEISKRMAHEIKEIQTPLGVAKVPLLVEQPVVAAILRAGAPMQQGVLNYFDKADVAFVSAYRKHKVDGSFDIQLGYCSCPSLEDRVLVVCDPMLATGSSIVSTLKELEKQGKAKSIHIICAIASRPGVEMVLKALPEATIWAGAVDEILNHHSYIVPGLGDAGDLAYGNKVQS